MKEPREKKPPKTKKTAKKEKLPPEPAIINGGINYAVYYMTVPERIGYTLLAGAVVFAIGYIFYRSVVLSALLSLLALGFPKLRTRQIIAQRRQKLTLQFKDMLYSLSSAISSGLSAEQALSVTLSDMERQYVDPETFIIKELELMVSRVERNQNIEDVFREFGERSKIDDIKTFAHIFEVSKRTGGNLIQIMRQSSDIIAEKIETKTEINTMLAEKKMEQKVLTIIPIGLVLMLTETTDGFMDPIFTTPMGRIVATIGLALIGVGYLWSKKLTDIEI